MDTLKKILSSNACCVFLFFLFPFISLSEIPPSDTPYLKQKINPQIQLFFSKDYQQHSLMLHQQVDSLYKRFQKEFFQIPIYKQNQITFVSPNTQKSDGTTFISPLPSIFIYSSPVQIMDTASIFTWSQDVLAHEMTHLYQINSQTRYSYWLSYLFPPIYWWIYPNILLNNLILEGHAVLYESIYGSGGRLFSGWARSLAFSQLKADIPLKRLLHKYNDVFSDTEKYIHGAYFYSYLLTQYPLEKINSFFKVHSQQALIPKIGLYSTNGAFKVVLGVDFYTLLNRYKNYYKSQALQQKKSPEKALLTSSASPSLNSNKTHIYFLISGFKSMPYLVALNKQTKAVSITKKDLPLGKVFLIDGTYYSRGTGLVTTTKQKFTLFKEGYKPLKKYISQYVQDWRPDRVLSLDTRQSLESLKLLVNNKPYGTTHSSAILGPQNHIYYFKNKGARRTLYKNQKPLVSFKSYYGFPVEADSNNIYFIAATKYGSSLFSYSQGQIFRLSQSDTIVNARKINSKEFLVTEITPKNFEYKVVKIRRKKEIPYFYQYAFKKKELKLQTISKKDHAPTTYHSFLDWKLRYGNFSLSLIRPKEFRINSSFYFIDSLNQNELTINHSWNKSYNHWALSYSNQKSRMAFQISPSYQGGVLSLENDKNQISTFEHLNLLTDKNLYTKWLTLKDDLNIFIKKKRLIYQDRSLLFKMAYPIFRKNRLTISLLNQLKLGEKQFNKDNKWISYLNNSGHLKLTYSRKYPLAFSEDQKLIGNTFYNLFYLNKTNKKYLSVGSSLFFQKNLGKETYISTYGSLTKGLWNRNPQRILNTERNKDAVFSFYTFKQQVQNLHTININLQKVLNHSLYPSYLPIALSRWAPFTGSSFISFEDKELETGYHYILHAYVGGSFEFMLNYKARAKVAASLGYLWKWQKHLGENPAQLEATFYIKLL